MLSIKNLSKRFGSKTVIDNVSFDVDKGKIAVLVGPSGVGKSTLLRVLNNLEKLDGGTITLNGKPLDPSTATKNCGMVFQQFNLFDHLTVLENITLALEKNQGKSKKESQKIATDLLAQYGLSDKIHEYPNQLSGGQKQRLAIARSVALKPKVICFDEPTSALDPLLTTHVANTIGKLAKEGYIVVIASHDTALLDKLDCDIYLMETGNIIESATSHALKTKPHEFPKISKFVAGTISE